MKEFDNLRKVAARDIALSAKTRGSKSQTQKLNIAPAEGSEKVVILCFGNKLHEVAELDIPVKWRLDEPFCALNEPF